jgi:hypothetical protein
MTANHETFNVAARMDRPFRSSACTCCRNVKESCRIGEEQARKKSRGLIAGRVKGSIQALLFARDKMARSTAAEPNPYYLMGRFD